MFMHCFYLFLFVFLLFFASLFFFFFFQAEDGIRDHCVTGVQTCALPIFLLPLLALMTAALQTAPPTASPIVRSEFIFERAPFPSSHASTIVETGDKIGRASCRERV